MALYKFDAAQICLNGHVVNDSAKWSPELNRKYCKECGEPTTTACPSCKAAIRGRMEGRGRRRVLDRAPSYCSNCGRAYPWIDRRLQAAKDLADELDELDQADRDKLKASLDDLAKNSPAAEVAWVRFKKIFAKLGKQSAGALRSIVVDVLSEAAKKALFPTP